MVVLVEPLWSVCCAVLGVTGKAGGGIRQPDCETSNGKHLYLCHLNARTSYNGAVKYCSDTSVANASMALPRSCFGSGHYLSVSSGAWLSFAVTPV